MLESDLAGSLTGESSAAVETLRSTVQACVLRAANTTPAGESKEGAMSETSPLVVSVRAALALASASGRPAVQARIAATLLSEDLAGHSLPIAPIEQLITNTVKSMGMLANSVPFCHTRIRAAVPLPRPGVVVPSSRYRLLDNAANRASRDLFNAFGKLRVAADDAVGKKLDDLGRPPLPPTYYEMCQVRPGVLAVHGKCGAQLLQIGGALGSKPGHTILSVPGLFMRVPLSTVLVSDSLCVIARAGHGTLRELFVESLAPASVFRIGTDQGVHSDGSADEAVSAGNVSSGAEESKDADEEQESKEADGDDAAAAGQGPADDAADVNHAESSRSRMGSKQRNAAMHEKLDELHGLMLEDLKGWTSPAIADSLDRFALLELSQDTMLPTGTVFGVKPGKAVATSAPGASETTRVGSAQEATDSSAKSGAAGSSETDAASLSDEARLQRQVFDDVVSEYGYLRVVSHGSTVYGLRLATCAEMLSTGVGLPDDDFVGSLPGAQPDDGDKDDHVNIAARLCPSLSIDTLELAERESIDRPVASSGGESSGKYPVVSRVQFLTPTNTQVLAGWSYLTAIREDVARIATQVQAVLSLRRREANLDTLLPSELVALEAEARGIAGRMAVTTLIESLQRSAGKN